MANQTAANVLAAIKRELSATPGVAAAGGAGAMQMRLTDSPGLTLNRGVIQSNERRPDGMRPMGHLGGKSVGGSYNCELTSGGFIDSLLEAMMRTTWSAVLNINAAAMSAATFTTTANTLVASAGSFITLGIKVGDLVSLTADPSVAGNVGIRLRVTNVTATVLTFAGTPLTANAVARAITAVRHKKLTTVGTPVRYSYSIDQYDEDIDQTQLFLGCRLVGMSISFRPNAMATASFTFMGMDHTILATAASPYFTSPTVTTGLALVADDSAIRFNGVDVVKFTGLDLNFQIAAAGQPVIGSVVSPDVFDNDMTVTGSISGIREDLAKLSLYEAETEFELSVVLQEPLASQPPALAIYLPRVKLSSAEAAFLGGDGPKIETFNLMVGPHAGSTIIDASAVNILSTAA
jgi:hypothetical protein